jgi:hypothetical protein
MNTRSSGSDRPRESLSHLLMEVDGWTGFSRHLEHAGGAEPRTADLLVHCHASILAQACNFGLTRMAQLADLSYRQLAWCTTWYLREETLQPAITSIVNHYRHPLARLWGGGTLSSSDGQRFPMADDLLRTAGSLKLGWVTASLFIAKLQSSRRKNALTCGIQEYGRLNKTIFILRYLLTEQVQRRIGVQINKGEALHALRGFFFLANEGRIRRRYYEEQLNQASCLNLVTNARFRIGLTLFFVHLLSQPHCLQHCSAGLLFARSPFIQVGSHPPACCGGI